MADTVEFELVTPAKLVLSRAVEMVVVPGGEGDFGVLPGHAPMIATVRPGVVDIHTGGKVSDRMMEPCPACNRPLQLSTPLPQE